MDLCFVEQIVLLSWRNGSLTCGVEPGVHSKSSNLEQETPRDWREPVARFEANESCRRVRRWWYVFPGIVRSQPGVR
jgi:hypothetical protein